MQIKELYRVFSDSAGVTTDTRTITGNEIFFALKGEHYDGNRFVQEALAAGCRLVIADDPALGGLKDVFVVPDALKSLQELATYHRVKWGGEVLAITGSNGKTTTRELVAAVLSRKFHLLSSTGNLNNHIGVPLTVLKIRDEELAVIEMGANHVGEIARLCEIAVPNSGIITNIGRAHLEGFGSLEGVRRAKGELYDFLADHAGQAIVNMSDPVLKEMATQRGLKIFSYGLGSGYEVAGKLLESQDEIEGCFSTAGEESRVRSALFGAYNFMNMLTAAAAGVCYGVAAEEISEAIGGYCPENNRSQIMRGRSNTLIMDAYNANPTSMSLALEEFIQRGHPQKMVILGDMYELGEDSEREHENILTRLAESDIREVLLVGEKFGQFSATPAFPFRFFAGLNECMDHLRDNRPEDHLILLKGSRKNALEKATNLLLDC
jgi:UDP-N-acetylmuramoyl-tripeptide--D-alanyl-D-alanine ligase